MALVHIMGCQKKYKTLFLSGWRPVLFGVLVLLVLFFSWMLFLVLLSYFSCCHSFGSCFYYLLFFFCWLANFCSVYVWGRYESKKWALHEFLKVARVFACRTSSGRSFQILAPDTALIFSLWRDLWLWFPIFSKSFCLVTWSWVSCTLV